jgi:hypothetical protein
VDPNGHRSSFTPFELAEIGKEVHRKIGQQSVSTTPPDQFRLTGQSVLPLLGLPLLGLPNPESGGKDPSFGISRLFPDLVDLTHKEVHEVKPLSVKGLATGVVQLARYPSTLNGLDLSGGWGVASGAKHYNSAAAFFTTRPFADVLVMPPVLGVGF